MQNFICTLPVELNNCEYRNKDGKCNFNESKCCFKSSEKENAPIQKKEKWYEIYYKIH